MKKLFILFIILFANILVFAQNSDISLYQKNDTIPIKDTLLENRVKVIEYNLTNTSVQLMQYQKYREISKGFSIFGSLFAVFGGISFIEEVIYPNPNFKNTMTLGLLGTSAVCFIISGVYTGISYKYIDKAGIEISSNINSLRIIYKF